MDAGMLAMRMARWWREEIAAMLPGLANDAAQAPAADLIVVARNGRLALWNAAQDVDEAGSDASILDRVANWPGHGTPRVILRWPIEECLVRQLDIPRAARADAHRIAALDLERTTPFKIADVATAVIIEENASDRTRLRLRQFVIKRRRLDPLLQELEAAGGKIVRVDGVEADGRTISIDFLAQGRPETAKQPQSWVTPSLLTALAALLLVTSAAISIWRREAVLTELRAQTETARAAVARQRRATERSQADRSSTAALRALKAQAVPSVVVLDTVSGLLPDSAWLTEFRLSNGTLSLSGYGRPAAALPPLIENALLFSSAQLTSPIVTDAARGRERFSLRARLADATRQPESEQP
jgi:general secretion pathway protein L